MTSAPIKMMYSSSLYRIKVELVRSRCLKSDAPPGDLVTRARAKMESVLMAGDIESFDVFESKLNSVWTAFRNANDLPEDLRVTMTLASGVLDLQGINVSKANGERGTVSISVTAPESTVSTWKYECFKTFVLKKSVDLGVTGTLNNAQLYSAYIRAASGELLENFQVGPAPLNDLQAEKPFSVIASKQRREICIVIRRVKELLDKSVRESLLQLVNQAVVKMSDASSKYVVQKKDLIAALQAILEGPEVLGEGLPAMLLAAHAPLGQLARTQEILPGHIHFSISDDKMEAAIAGFDSAWYKDSSFDISVAWIQAEMKRCSIKAAISEDAVKKISEMIIAHENLNGTVVCHGVAPEGGKEPYIFQSYKESAIRSTADMDNDSVNLRDLQQRTLVKGGQLIAELRYKKPPRNGSNVYGDIVEPLQNDNMIIHIGEGVQQKGRRFYATHDGVPVIGDDAISLSKTMIFNGDVNLRTGNIRFDGPVEITGSIDNGSVVEVTGDLVIHGTVRGAFVKAGGSITVYAGIVTGNQGKIFAGGDISAEFVENSSITCRGNLKVGKAILNCNVVSNGSIEVRAKDGVLAGGKIICREQVRAANLGFRRGALTELVVGIDWRIARRIEIRRARLANLEKASQDYRQNLREIVQKSRNQMAAKHKLLKDELQSKLGRIRPIIERMEKFIQESTAQLTFNPNAKIMVDDQLVSNVQLQLCGQNISVSHDVAHVAILPKRQRGSYIVPLEEIEAEERTNSSGRRAV